MHYSANDRLSWSTVSAEFVADDERRAFTSADSILQQLALMVYGHASSEPPEIRVRVTLLEGLRRLVEAQPCRARKRSSRECI